MKSLLLHMMAVGLGLIAAGCSAQASAADFPSKPIRWIMPLPPGGPSDAVARIVSQRLSERLNQPVLVDNRAGAFGAIGMEAAARAAPDGHTIVFGAPGTVLINPVLHKLNFDPMTELAAVSQLTRVSFVLVVNRDFPARTLSELLATAKARPGAVTCGSGAALMQLACELLKLQGGVDMRGIPYKGGAPAMNDLVGGQIDFLFEVTNVAIPQVKADRIRAIATTNPKRGMGPFGHLPSANESLPGFELDSWFGVLAPRATPADIIARLNRELASVLADDDVRKRLTDGGLEIAHGSPEAFTELLRRDRAKYSRIIREAGIKAEGS